MGDSAALAKCIRRLLDEPDLLPALRRQVKPIETTLDVASRIAGLYKESLIPKKFNEGS